MCCCPRFYPSPVDLPAKLLFDSQVLLTAPRESFRRRYALGIRGLIIALPQSTSKLTQSLHALSFRRKGTSRVRGACRASTSCTRTPWREHTPRGRPGWTHSALPPERASVISDALDNAGWRWRPCSSSNLTHGRASNGQRIEWMVAARRRRHSPCAPGSREEAWSCRQLSLGRSVRRQHTAHGRRLLSADGWCHWHCGIARHFGMVRFSFYNFWHVATPFCILDFPFQELTLNVH